MGFAEQLAAKAAETQVHHQTSSGRRRRLTPPRPGKINRGRATVSGPASSGEGGASSSSPNNTFADQLKQRKAGSNRRDRHTVSSTSTSSTPTKSFADQISERSIASSPASSVASSPANSIRHIKPKILMPSPGKDNYNDESDEDDEYAAMGFSLTDASPMDHKNNKANEGGTAKAKKKKSSRKLQPISTASASAADDIISEKGGDHTRQGEAQNDQNEPSSPPRTKSDVPAAPPFQINNLSPIKDVIDPTTHKKSPTYPSQDANSSELRSKLREQLLKSQTQNDQRKNKSDGDTNNDVHEKQSNDDISKGHDKNKIFGAWAQIESLQQRVAEAERRALQESQRAEIASHELRMVKEQQRKDPQKYSEPQQNKGNNSFQSAGNGNSHTDSSLIDSDRVVEGTASVLREDATVDHTSVKIHEGGSSRDTTSATALHGATLPQDTEQNSPRMSSDTTHEDIEAALLWKKRALEAEERLAKEIERLERSAAAAPQSAPPTHHEMQPQPPMSANSTITTEMITSTSRLEESDIIHLKNAEIDVLRNQIHRLERRIQEECERNEDLLRSSYHHLDPLHGDGHPPLVVASECMATSTRHTSDMDEFRLLRNEIRHLQYQLRTKSSGTMAHGATTTSTGESTLSSLDGNENSYNNNSNDEEEGDDDNDDAVRGASSSWGLCCIRGSRSRRGYGRV